MLKGNKGEWSEIYVFLKLLSDGKLDAADENLKAVPNVSYPLIKIVRDEPKGRREYEISSSSIIVIDANTNNVLCSIPQHTFSQKAQELLLLLKSTEGRTLDFPVIESFLKTLDVATLTAITGDKTDIHIVLHDHHTGMKPKLGFSIKSMLGKDATLFNPGAGTNFIYKLSKPETLVFDVQKFNTDTLEASKKSPKFSKLGIRLAELANLGFSIDFDSIESENLSLNLTLIDSQLPEILAFVILERFRTGKSKLTELLQLINLQNPLNFKMGKGHPFYEVKIKNFLTESALGMTPEELWTGVYDATGGIIIAKKTGDLVCYYIYNRKEFQEYLLHHTKLEQASTSEDDNNPGHAKLLKAKPYKFGWVYEENGQYFIKLNLQVRFI